MATKFQKWLAGFQGYKRSYNLGVLSRDTELKTYYSNAQQCGKLPFNRTKVMILGDARVGKTSLRRLLTGEKFHPDEPSTEGIETKMYESKDVDDTWQEYTSREDDDFELGSSWYTAKTAMESLPSSNVRGRSRRRKNIRVNINYSARVMQLMKDILFIARFLFAASLLCAVLFSRGLIFGFAIFEWGIFLSTYLTGVDFLTEAYRYGTGLAIMMAFDNYFRHYVTLSVLLDSLDVYFFNLPLLSQFTFCMLFTLFGFAMGVLFGVGGRTGVAFGLCLLVTPCQLLTLEDFRWSSLSMDVTSAVTTLVCFLGNVFGVLLYRCLDDIAKVLPWVLLPNGMSAILSLLFAMSVFLYSTANALPNILPFVMGALLWFGKVSGEITGRDIDLKYGGALGYLTKKCIGVLTGLFIGYCMGWRFHTPSISFFSLTTFILSILTHPAIEFYVFCKVKWQALPLVKVRDALKRQVKGSKLFTTRLSLWDFAGQALYYNTHHVFISNHAVYLLVFNLEEAASGKAAQLERILFWLNSVYTHARDEDAVIFLVGTHRDSITSATRNEVAEYLYDKLYANFCSRLIMNPDGSPIFVVESSKPLDQDVHELQTQIMRRVQEAEYMSQEYPIKYLLFYRIIKEKREEAETEGLSCCICSFDEVRDLAKVTCHVDSTQEFNEMLEFFYKAGEIIYQSNDNTLKDVIIFDPQVLVDIMKNLFAIPPIPCRSHKMAVYWWMLQTDGIAHRRLISHIGNPMKLPNHVTSSLLEAYDLICPIPITSNSDDQLFIVPSLLPFHTFWESNANNLSGWTSLEDDEEYYIDFGCFLPDSIFWRLMARCLKSENILSRNTKRQVYRDVGIFAFGHDYSYKLDLVHHLPEQQLIKVTVQNSSGQDSKRFMLWLLGELESIKRRDFPCLKYSCGVLCPMKGKHASFVNPDKLHIVKLAGHDRRLSQDEQEGNQDFRCEGQKCSIKIFPKKKQDPRGGRFHPVRVTIDTPIAELPPSLYKYICNNLNSEQPLSGDWKDLAGELEHTQEDVHLLRNEINPCSTVLRHWSNSGQATVRNLIEILERPSLGRRDLISQ
ncbi:uncharacterized protein [Ptychodera flava]|uniref:uncharacterized protein isoform X2 n=1 Tax=Ptychodera flava TaxID=63121 RepID=UPI00396A0985